MTHGIKRAFVKKEIAHCEYMIEWFKKKLKWHKQELRELTKKQKGDK